jgi:hypothetical protein
MTTTIKVIDSIMGAGKTSFAIQMMNDHPEERFCYVTPYKTEIARIVDACPGFRRPKARPRKIDDLKRLLQEGHSIAFSHKLFEDVDAEVLGLVAELGYTLILDEVMDVLHQPPRKDPNRKKRKVSDDDDNDEGDSWTNDDEESPEAKSYREWIQGLLDHNVLVRGAEGNCVKLKPGTESRFPEFSHLQRYAREGRLVMVNGSLLIWQFPVNCFESFKTVWNLTYLFGGTYQKAYYDLHSLGYDLYSVVKVDGRYKEVEHSAEHDRPVIERAKELIKVCEGVRNKLGTKTNRQDPLSKKWFEKQRRLGKSIMKTTSNWFGPQGLNVPVKSALWTTHKSLRDRGLYPPSYKRAFQPMNTRATNAFRDRTAVAYLINRFFNVPVERYFTALNVGISQDQFALSEMIQFIWRSAIRDGKPIDLFVPSSRMRSLLFDWLNGNIGNLHPPVGVEEYEPNEEAEEVKVAA